MDYGTHGHVSSPEDRTILTCMACSWEGEFSSDEMKAKGAPWYCGNCGKKVYHFIKFAPDEREEAYRRQAQWRPDSTRYGITEKRARALGWTPFSEMVTEELLAILDRDDSGRVAAELDKRRAKEKS